ncbi:NB-ARC domain-containing protein [Streptomyces sp. NPDC056909]|uniref:NB-ARC domain-containing protein n=1 Tax=Streptomyces sp. NPDC056909 TaxID=3345963 RepID=UPI0036BEFB02
MTGGGNTFGGNASAHSVVQARQIDSFTQHVHVGADAPLPAPAPAPAPECQLPVEEQPFENRAPERELVGRELAARGRSARPVRPLTVVLSGVSGIGKTALAVRLAHELEEHGLLSFYVDLDEWRTAGAIDLTAVLRHLLGWLTPAESQLPEERRALENRYRARTRDTRLALVLDNVWSADEITTLLPVSAESVVLVASQERLSALESRGALGLALEPLSFEHASEVLRQIVGGQAFGGRTAGGVNPGESSQALATIARLCAGFPIALHTAGKLLRAHPTRRMERIVDDLTKDLHEKGLPVVEAVWNAAYAALDPPAARLYRLMPHHPGYDITLDAVTALLGTGLDDGEDGFDGLTNAGLLALSPRAGRRRMHSLLRAHAVRCAGRHGDPAETEEGLRRLLVWYRRQAERADRAIGADRMRMAEPVPELPYAPDVPFASAAEAGAWLDAERKALYGLVRIAGDLGEDTHAWSLCEPLWKHYEDHGNHEDAIRAFETGRDCAQRDGAAEALIRMRCQLAQALWKAGRAEDADTETRQAVLSAESVVPGEKPHASALEFRGKYLAWRGEPEQAVVHFQRSRGIHLTIENPYGVLLQTFLVGRTLRAAGRLAEAEAELETARRMAVEQNRSRVTGRAVAELARTHRALGRTAQAVAAYEEALAHERARGSVHDQIALHDELAGVTEESGDPEAAERHRARARELRVQMGMEAEPED